MQLDLNKKPHNYKRIIGIYTIKNKVNNKIYVGLSKDTRRRFQLHLNSLRLNEHKNFHLQSSFNKYGEENFEFEVLEECNVDFLDSMENYWCILLNTHNDQYGYNIRQTSHDPIKRMSDKTKKKLSMAHLGKKIAKEHKEKMSKAQLRRGLPQYRSPEAIKNIQKANIDRTKPVLQYDLEGNFIKEWKSRMEASEKLNIGLSGINNCTLGYSDSSGGYIWKFKYNYEKN